MLRPEQNSADEPRFHQLELANAAVVCIHRHRDLYPWSPDSLPKTPLRALAMLVEFQAA